MVPQNGWHRGEYDRLDRDPYAVLSPSLTRPAPPRSPIVARYIDDAYQFGELTSYEKREKRGSDKMVNIGTWRLRWTSLLLLLAACTQAISVGRLLDAPAGCAAQTGGTLWAIIQLGILLVAMWSLLSQLLQWSDAAVMRIPPQYDQRGERRDGGTGKSNTPRSDPRKDNGPAREEV
jgi:hypothetical protein